MTEQSPDHCPTCGRHISDYDMEGCEAPSGQRWCISHALERLDELTAPPSREGSELQCAVCGEMFNIDAYEGVEFDAEVDGPVCNFCGPAA